MRGRWMERLRCEPPGKFLAAAVARRRRRLIMAFGLSGRAYESHMEMIIMAPPRPDFGQPGAVSPCLTAQFALDRRIDKNPRDLRLTRYRPVHFEIGRVPNCGIDTQPVGGDDLGGGHFVSCARAQPPSWHW